MGLETATYIHQLNPSNPVGSEDPKGQGDDHIRMMKDCILNTLPNIEGAVNASHTELNYVVGVTSAIQTQLNAKAAANQFASGIYVPTPFAVLNCSIDFVANDHHYSRVGNIVTVSGSARVNVTSSAAIETAFSIGIPLVRDTNFSGSFQVTGTGGNNLSNASQAVVQSVGGDQRAKITFYSKVAGNQTVFYIFQYPLED